uniref:Uncharacterized protein n=1 Tax=Panagrolaimus sp. PS1159 TaxID=55785 RepID=A0AC35GW07_9BILA
MKSAATILCFVFAITVIPLFVYSQICCDGTYSSGPCVNDACPTSKMCQNGMCSCVNDACPTSKMCQNGMCCMCRDTCYDCYLYIGYCNNTYYANCMSGCQYTCGKCHY